VDLHLNELSMTQLAPDRATASEWLLSLQETIRAAAVRGVSSVLHTHQDFWNTPISEGYSVVQWLADATIERERRQRLRSAVGKAPFLETLHAAAEEAQGGLFEAHCEGRRGLGIGLAAMAGDVVVSLPTSAFRRDPLSVAVTVLDEGSFIEKVEQVCNFYGAAVVERRSQWIALRQQENVRSGREIVRLRSSLLERIDFTESALAQLSSLRGSEQVFPFVLRHLFALNSRARAWDGATPFSREYPFNCSEESATTLAMYGDARTFLCPDGERRTFSWHSKINYEKWRIHFIDLPDTRRVLVGYVGRHLPLAG
jgi:hypothetical protein